VDRVRATQPALTVESAMAHAAGVGHLLYSGRPVEGARAARDLLARADAAGIEPAAGLLECLLGMAMTQLGDPAGEPHARRGLQRLRAVQFPMLPTVAWAVAWNMLWSGRYGPCAEAVAFARELVEPGDVTAAWLDVIDATLAYAAGSWDAPAGIVDRLVDRSRLDLGFVLPWAYGLRGRIRFARGDLDGALADARASAEAAAQPGHWFQLVFTAVHCRALLARGLRDQAAAAVDSILAELRERPVGSTATPDLAIALHDLGYPADALPDVLPPTPNHVAVRAMAAGDAAEAVRRYEEIGSLPDAADARLRAAAAHAAAGRAKDARDVLAPAIRLWRATAATGHLREAEAVLAGPPSAE